MNVRTIVAILMLLCGAGVATALAAQHQWVPSQTTSADALRPSVNQPRAVLGPATGIYCPDMSEGAFGVHDLGWIPAGLNVEVNVESYSQNEFDPVAGIVVATLGVPAANTIKATTFYDNDSGGGKDVRIAFVSPQAGTYVLFVTDNSGKVGGCYRYQALIR